MLKLLPAKFMLFAANCFIRVYFVTEKSSIGYFVSLFNKHQQG
jgi:hypothetical protein